MAPTEQEERCAALLCEHLSGNPGGKWRVDVWLDDLNTSEPTPDVVLTNGVDCIAVEIKQLTDGEVFHTNYWNYKSLCERLTPESGGEFALFLPNVRSGLDRKLISQLKNNIADASPHLETGQTTVISFSRQATIEFCGKANEGSVFCRHTHDDFMPIGLQGISGRYFLNDDGPNHKFISDACREAFQRRLKHACERSLREGPSQVEWNEEWKLKKLRDLPNHETLVSVIGLVTADFLESAAIESVVKEIEKSKRKFKAWTRGGRLAVALHAGEQQREVPPSYFHSVLTKLEPTDVHPLDLVFLVSEGQVRHCLDFTH